MYVNVSSLVSFNCTLSITPVLCITQMKFVGSGIGKLIFHNKFLECMGGGGGRAIKAGYLMEQGGRGGVL